LYYYGAMQWILLKLGWLLQKLMGTTVCESVNAAASIFLSMVIIKKYLNITLLSRLV
jgi:pyrimidine nucleoside transport protein